MKTLKKSLALTFASAFMMANISLAAPQCTATWFCAFCDPISCTGVVCLASGGAVNCTQSDGTTITKLCGFCDDDLPDPIT